MRPIEPVRPDEKYALRMKEASALIGLSRSKLYELIRSGRLVTLKVGGRRLVTPDALKALLDEGNS
jgi:excisionase family DNA binding protein